MNFSLDDLRAFVAVAERSSFRAAADAIHVSQPAISRRIDKLEESLGLRLFDRTTRSVELTAVGREFEPRARQLLHDLQNALLDLGVSACAEVPKVRIACVTSAVRYLLAEALIAFRRHYPGVRVLVVDGGAQDVISSVANGEVDFGFSFLGEQNGNLDYRPIFSDAYVAICHRDHELARRQRLTWRELVQSDYLSLSQENGNRRVIDRALGNQLRPQPVCEVRRISSLLGLVEAQVGVAAVPRLALPLKHDALAVIPLTEPVITRCFGVMRRSGFDLPPAARTFLNFFSEWSLHALKSRD